MDACSGLIHETIVEFNRLVLLLLLVVVVLVGGGVVRDGCIGDGGDGGEGRVCAVRLVCSLLSYGSRRIFNRTCTSRVTELAAQLAS